MKGFVDDALKSSSLTVAEYRTNLQLLTEENAELSCGKKVVEQGRSSMRSELVETRSQLEDSRRRISSVDDAIKASSLKVVEFKNDLKLLTEEHAEISRAMSAVEDERSSMRSELVETRSQLEVFRRLMSSFEETQTPPLSKWPGSYRHPSPKYRSGPGTQNGVQIQTPRKVCGR